ncbi:ribosome biogenesis GTPase Der [Candidatus Saccharibacteria bacterium]|nr:ribosome biogenesis GTPase Der [Candidatus Saccharibacteria bacterium]
MYPVVALVGPTNAGKSSLMNRFSHKNLAIVAREEGTTRDPVSNLIDNTFTLVDTAGLKPPADSFEATIQEQITDAIDSADLILLTLDSTKYPGDAEKRLAKSALKSKKPVALVLNKSDLKESLGISEFLRLGIHEEQIFYVSATTGAGIKELKQYILSIIPQNSKKVKPEESALKLSLIGRPNVGKSSLFNSLAKKQQAIVSSRAGTTRDLNRLNLKFKSENFEIIDTAGLRKPGKREVGIEKFSALRTLSAIQESDISALLIDATNPHSKLDQSLAGEIVKQGKSIILVLTKADLVENTDKILDELEYDYNFIPFAPVLITSSETGKNVMKLLDLALTLNEYRHERLKTSELNEILEEAIKTHAPSGLKNTRPAPKYIVQTDVAPPWFVVHGHNLELLHWSWQRHLEKIVRSHHPFIGTPINFSFKSE